MRVDTRWQKLIFPFMAIAIFGCSSGGGDDGVTPPIAHPPTVEITQGPPATINPDDDANFVWQGDDEDGDLAGYFIKLDGSFQTTSATAITYSNLTPGTNYVFYVFAVDSGGLHSDTASWAFAVAEPPSEITLGLAGIGVTDEDGDAFWTEYQIRWCPQFSTGATTSLRLVYVLQTTFGSNPEIMDSTNLFSRDPGATDTLDFLIPPQTKNYYDIRAELHDADGAILVDIPYDSIASLTEIGLEDLDGFHAWFDDAWTDNAVDTLPPSGYYESIDLWWDVDAYPDAGRVKVVVYERNSAGEESNFFESQLYDVAGFSSNDVFGLGITAGTTIDAYDYRLKLLDQQNTLLDEINYGDDPDLMDIPLGIGTGFQPHNEPQMISSKP